MLRFANTDINQLKSIVGVFSCSIISMFPSSHSLVHVSYSIAIVCLCAHAFMYVCICMHV